MFYKYDIGWYDSYHDQETYSKGIVFGNNYGNATDNLIRNYGEDVVFEISLKGIVTEDEEGYCLSEEELKSTFEEN